MKILAIGNAHALAHVSRLLEISKILRMRGHEIAFSGQGKYLQVAAWDGFQAYEVPYVPVEQAVKAIRSQKLWELFPEAQLKVFIKAEQKLYERFRPDLVLIDNRPTARTSADASGLKTVSVLNAHMSNYRRIPFFSYIQLAGTARVPGLGLADRLENTIENLLYDRLVMGGLNKLRHRLNLERLFAYEHEEANLSLLADTPEFNPTTRLPIHIKYIGPITWHNVLPAPTCLDKLDPGKTTAYFTLGSEGLDELVGELGILTSQGIQVVVATGAANVADGLSPPAGVFLEQYVNTDLLLPHCHLVCCHGGNGTLYQALSFGLPVVVVSTHAEQHYGGKRIQQLGFGKAITLKRIRAKGVGKLVGLVQEVLETPAYRTAAQAFAATLKVWNSAELAANAIETMMENKAELRTITGSPT